MERDRGFRIIAIIAICLSVVGLGIGYSALNATLNINTKTTLKGSSWSINVGNISEPSIVGSAAEVNAPTNVSSTITFDVSLKKPGDSITYIFDVVNDGTLDAKLSSTPTFTGVTEAAEKAITYKLTYADGTEIAANDTLVAGSSNAKKMKMVVTYDSDATTVQSEDTTLSIKATLLYVQQ